MAIIREIDLGLSDASDEVTYIEHPVCHENAKVLDVFVRRVIGYEHDRRDFSIVVLVMDIGVPEVKFGECGPNYPGCILRQLVCVRKRRGPQTEIPRTVGAYLGTVQHPGGMHSGPAVWHIFESKEEIRPAVRHPSIGADLSKRDPAESGRA